MATGPFHQWARVGAARAERAEGRSRRLVSITVGRSRCIPADALREFITREIEEAA
ncbi:hypothetical protein ACQPXS_18635 [Streptomyces sp. CA-142005]|uniref:hypothetical protein n=1 Tax=Streptomyces sp. CA-142005 TaxID=3240052 RepID=UPI003D93CCE3